jgi:hypothetical protein
MKRITLLAILLINVLNVDAQQAYEGMAEESLIIKTALDNKVHSITPNKAYVSIGKTLSRIRIKKSEIPGVVVKGNNNAYYVRGKTGIPSLAISLVKLNEKGKTLQSFYSDDLGKKFQIIPTTLTAADKDKKIFRVNVLGALENGYYAFFFKRADGQGNFRMSGGASLTYKPMVFQIENPTE